MPDPALKKSVAQLAGVLKQLHEESSTLNATIEEIEKSLVEMNPGITTWSGDFLRYDEDSSTGSQLGFAKHDDEWGLFVRRGHFTEPERQLDRRFPSAYIRLLDATRDERATAVDQFPSLVEALTQAAKEHLEKLQRVNRQAR